MFGSKKKVPIAMAIAFVTVLVLASVNTIDGSNGETDYKSLFAGGDGTEKDPWQISNATELRNIVNTPYNNGTYYYTLVSDININGSWTSIGNSPFVGIFNGAYHTISGIAGNSGLFENIGQGGIVKNTAVNVNLSASSRVGGIADYCNGTIENCVVNGSVSVATDVNNWTYAGGIAGIVDSNGIIEGCTNNSSVSAKGHPGVAGGIAGKTDSPGGTIKNCLNNGRIYSNQALWVPGIIEMDETAVSGGILGFAQGKVDINNCLNTGVVTADSGEYIRFWNGVGGLIGMVDTSSCTINDSFSLSGVVNSIHNGDDSLNVSWLYTKDSVNVTTSNARVINSEESVYSGTYVTWSTESWKIINGSCPETKWLSGIEIDSIVGNLHNGIQENVVVNVNLLFNTGNASQIQTVYHKTNINSTNVSIKYSSYSDSKSFTALNPEHIEVTKLPDKQIYTVGSNLETRGLEVTTFYEDGTSVVVPNNSLLISYNKDNGEQMVTISYKDLTTTFNAYFHTSDEYGILLYGYGSNNPVYITCKTGDSIKLQRSTMEGYSFSGWYNSPENGMLITSDETYTPESSMILYERMTENKNNDDGGLFGCISLVLAIMSSGIAVALIPIVKKLIKL